MALKKHPVSKTQSVKAASKGKVALETPPQKPAPLPKLKMISRKELLNTVAKATDMTIREAEAIMNEVINGMVEALLTEPH